MGEKTEEKVIKPPVRQITSGKIFKPSRAFLYKQLFQVGFVYVLIWFITILCFAGISFVVAADDPGKYSSAAHVFNSYFVQVNLWTLGANLVWFVLALIAIPPYFRSMEYSVKAESGDIMPEIYSKRGIITITRKHVPFRTITNISSRAGPFDRLFKIGSVHIETAGYSGANQQGPEEKISGIMFYEEVRDFILKELRKFKDPYATGTEVVLPKEEPVSRVEGRDDEILIALREIRDILRNKRRNSKS